MSELMNSELMNSRESKSKSRQEKFAYQIVLDYIRKGRSIDFDKHESLSNVGTT